MKITYPRALIRMDLLPPKRLTISSVAKDVEQVFPHTSLVGMQHVQPPWTIVSYKIEHTFINPRYLPEKRTPVFTQKLVHECL